MASEVTRATLVRAGREPTFCTPKRGEFEVFDVVVER
jgi:hypothetical protein